MLSPWNVSQYTSIKQQIVRESKPIQSYINNFPSGVLELLQNHLSSLKVHAGVWIIFLEQFRRTS